MLFIKPVALKLSIDLVRSFESASGLEMKFLKIFDTPNTDSAQICRQILATQLDIFEDEEINHVYLFENARWTK